MPRTIPKFLTIRYPGNSFADVTIELSTRPVMLFSLVFALFTGPILPFHKPPPAAFPFVMLSLRGNSL
jgi:hypothetical protein